MYLAVYGVLFVATCLKTKYKQLEDKIYKFLIVALWLFLALRWGQGTDFFGYYYIFQNINTLKDAVINPLSLHSEIGFRILCWLFRDNYFLLIFSISTFEMLMLDRFIKRHCENKILSLLLFYPTFYLTYFFSALRAGLVIAIILGYAYDMLLENKLKSFCACILLAACLHSVALVFLLAPIFMRIRFEMYPKFFAIALGLSVIFSIPFVNHLIAKVPYLGPKIAYYISAPTISVFAFAERTISVVLIFVLRECVALNERNVVVEKTLRVYCGGFLIYLLLLTNPFMASRAFALYKVLEIPLFAYYATRMGRYKTAVIALVILMSFAMTIKNIYTYTYEGEYFDFVNVLNFPYVSVFNKEDIYNFRTGYLMQLL